MKISLFLFTILPFSALSLPVFQEAQPVWPTDRATEMNVTTVFHATITADASGAGTLRLTASTLYRAFLNGEYLGCGPARGPHGHYRVDEWPLALSAGENAVAIEVAGYNANSYYLLDQPSFLQAEILQDGKVVAATGGEGFSARILSERVQKVQRYSFQRPFTEVYRLTPASDGWRTRGITDSVELDVAEAKALLPRHVPYSDYTLAPGKVIARGTAEQGVPVENLWKDRSLTQISPKLKGYPEDELEVIPSIEMQHIATRDMQESDAAFPVSLVANEFVVLDLDRSLSGFIGANVTCQEPTRFFVLFDEMLREGEVDWKRLGCVDIVSYELQPGKYALESFEPYTLRYGKVIVLEGALTLEDFYLRRYENSDTKRATFSAPDDRLMKLFEAGRSTFAQNATDVFMDCPSRERAGWLCDSFFTARVAQDLNGHTHVEENFFENLALPESFAHLPKGMWPMCYPSDHYDGVFIPNWALWGVVQLGDYHKRSGDQATIDAMEKRVFDLFDYFKAFENEDGLIEKLESWVFVEWSKANEWVQDLNYPSNMLYAGALDAAARLYEKPELAEKADQIRKTVLVQSYNGNFFVDNALRKDGKLEVTNNMSEVCQYFAFFFGLASPETHPELWAKLRHEFGPKRVERGLYPEVAPANSFIGNMLRVEILSQAGRSQQILDESIDYLMYMAERTGTLWENTGDYASLNHGFASHICHTLYRDVLGVYAIDPVKKEVTLRFTELDLPKCSGTIPVGDEVISLEWELIGDTIAFTLDTPPGYTQNVINLTNKRTIGGVRIDW
jgi:alpha-L-rhamnosidase